ncbi:MAG: transglutaminase-like domain-containing protein [Deltaproteobacteria bacterium]|nr:transglutaminase-like domain-containing protein [Deltaproteobacteria bacterium]
MLERDLGPVEDGACSPDPAAPVFTRAPTPARLAACYEVLDEAVMRRTPGEPRRLSDPRTLRRLRALPLVLSEASTLHRPGAAIVRADPALREIYAGLRAFVHPEHDAAVEPDDPARATATAFVDRLGVRQLGVLDLVTDLESELGEGPVADLSATTFPGTAARLNAALTLLAEASVPVQRRAARLPVFVAQDGRYHRAARGPGDHQGVLLFEPGHVGTQLLAYYGQTRPVHVPGDDDPGLALLRSARTPLLSLDSLVADLRERTEPLDAPELDRLHALLEAIRDEVPARARRQLAELPIWPDTTGRCRPLVGDDAVRLPHSPQIAALLPDVPFLHPSVLARQHAADMGGEHIGLDALVDALATTAKPPLRIEPTPASSTAALQILCASKDAIHPRLRARLAKVPVFMDDRDEGHPLGDLSLAEDPELRRVYGDWPSRHFVDPQSLTRSAITELELDARLERVDAATLTIDLGRQHQALDGQTLGTTALPVVGDADHLALLLEYCARQAATLPRTVLVRLTQAPIFVDVRGRLGPLGDTKADPDQDHVYACSPPLRPLLDAVGTRVLAPWAQELVGPLVETSGRGHLDIAALVRQLSPLSTVGPGQPRAAVQSDDALAQIQAALVEAAPALARDFGPKPREGAPPSSPTLGTLAIWPTAVGGVVTAHDAIDSQQLSALLPPDSPARSGLDAVTVHEAHVPRLRALAPLVLPASPRRFAAELVRLGARPNAPLAEQPPTLRDLDRIAQLFAFIGPDHEPRPLVGADGRLSLQPLCRASADTVELVHGTAFARTLLHPQITERLPADVQLPGVEPAAVLDALLDGRQQPGPMAEHPILCDEQRRQRLYTWVVAHESAVFTSPDARARLRSLPLWPTDRGTLRPSDQLVVDPDLPELDVDWTPHPELPEPTLALLVRHLGIGRPPVEDLVADHLAPAYRAAAARGDGPGAARLLDYLAGAVTGASADDVHGWLADEGTIRVEGGHERFVPASTLLLPPADLTDAVEAVFGGSHPPPHARLTPGTHGLLIKMGVMQDPPAAWVAEAMHGGVTSTTVAAGLASLVAHLHRGDPEGTVATLPLRDTAWVLDGNGVARRPPELFAWTTDVQALVGDAPGLYPAPEISRTLGDTLCASLGLRTAADVRLHEVVDHIDASRAASIPLPFRVYQWLERGLSEGWLDGASLRRQLAGRAWICSDDGEYHPDDRVLAVRALEDFGTRRGYWERGHAKCPTLCRRFGIPTRITAQVRAAFIEEIATDAASTGDRNLLTAEPAIPRMLLRAYAGLGPDDDPPLASVVLARQCGGNEAGALRLRPRTDPLLLRSDTPALEALFAAVGELFVAAPGPRDQRVAIDAYYEHCGIRRLRDAYEVRVAAVGEDQTAHHAEAIAGLRVTLRGLLSILPRVRMQRTHLSTDGWVYDERLASLSRTGPIHAQHGLEVDYILEDVGHARTRATAVYDPGSAALLVDTGVLRDPESTVTGLAQGLMACIYDGPGEEQLVDIVEILLRLRTRERMDAYLDQRLFPSADEPEVGQSGRLAARVGELFDYGLDRRLVSRFDELQGRPLDRWREPALFESIPPDQEQAVRTVVARMLAAVELSAAPQPMVEALALLLSAESLSDVPAGLLTPQTPAEPMSASPPSAFPSRQDAGSGPSTSDGVPSLAELEARLEAMTAGGQPGELSQDSSTHRFVMPPDRVDLSGYADDAALDADDSALDADAEPLRSAEDTEPTREPDAARSAPAEGGFWSRLARRLGLSDPEPVEETRPTWAEPGANVLGPSTHIGPQLWVRGRTLREMATHRIPMGLLHQPRVLPAPYRYCVHTLGAKFDAQSQRWLPQSLPRLTALFDGEPTGYQVAFAGQLTPGRSVLPIPLFGDITRLEVLDAEPSALRPRGRLPGGSAVVDVDAESPIQVRYEVALRRPPSLSEATTLQWDFGGPTLPREALPRPVRTWLERNASTDRGGWEQARRVEAFVQRHYVYDLDFRERPEVQRAASELRPGVGNHHLALLHASGEGAVLGRGVCYELNVLVVELCRHLGLPAVVATGWMLDEGFAARPDHLFALALVPTVAGTCLLPLDASTGPGGHVRPLAGAEPPTVGVQPPARPPIPDTGGGWTGSVLAGPDREAAIEDHVHEIHRAVRAELDRQRQALRRIIRIAEAAAGRQPDPATLADDDVEQLRRRALAAVGNRDRLLAMLAVIRGDYERAAVVPEPVQTLVREGLATVQTYPSYRVRPSDERDA